MQFGLAPTSIGSKAQAGLIAVVSAALVIVAGCGARGLPRADAPLVCPKTDGLAERAVAAAVAAFPGPLDADKLDKRGAYINHNMARLFDPDGTGYLDFQRYDDWTWSIVMVVVPSARCAMDLHQYRNYLHGSDDNITQIDINQPFVANVDAITFAQLSGDGKYITRRDLARHWSLSSFRNFDTSGDGRAPLNGNLATYTGRRRN